MGRSLPRAPMQLSSTEEQKPSEEEEVSGVAGAEGC